jgi:cytochrome c556
MKHGAIALVLLVVGTASVFAGPIEDRKALMKQNADAAKIGTGLAKGELPYDQAKAEDVLKVHAMVAAKLPTLVPEDSKTGDKTTASPRIWEDMAGFKAAAAKFQQDATNAMAQTKDQASFAKAYAVVVSNCGACHQTYRIKQQ